MLTYAGVSQPPDDRLARAHAGRDAQKAKSYYRDLFGRISRSHEG